MAVQIATDKLTLRGPTGTLEALLDREETEHDPKSVAVICHPHPLFDGAMTNKVVYILARTLAQHDIPALRFNFRGVGASEGKYGGGEGETEDTLAVLDWARSQWPHAKLWLGGFSFGAYTAYNASSRRDIAALITVAPPVEHFDMSALATPLCPWLLIQGEADEVVAASAVLQWARCLAHPPMITTVPEVGHYFHGKLGRLRALLIDALPALRGDAGKA